VKVFKHKPWFGLAIGKAKEKLNTKKPSKFYLYQIDDIGVAGKYIWSDKYLVYTVG